MLQSHLRRIFAKFCDVTANSIAALAPAEKLQYLEKIKQSAKVQYKLYPALPHQDPNSPEYIHSELDEYHDEVAVRAYNKVIDDFNNDLAMQKKVWDALANLERPYKKGIRGVDTNLYATGPVKPQLEDLGFPRAEEEAALPFYNEDRFIANTVFHSTHTFPHYQEWEKERLNRPVTRDFNGKGYKYNIPVKLQEKYEFMADRLGHPEFLGSPVDRLFKLENDIFHPTYLDQPFVKTPSANPSPTLNFEQGEVIYENTQVLEWLKLLQTGGFAATAFLGIWIPFNLAFKTNLVLDIADELVQMPYHVVSPTSFDILRLSIPIGAASLGYATYVVMNGINAFASEYIIKMSFSKDRELVFIKRIDLHGKLYEQVYEMAHLQILPPRQRSGVKDLSSQDQDGLWRVTCMNSQRTMLFYNNKSYWNSAEREHFFKNMFNLWDKAYYGFNRPEDQARKAEWREQASKEFTQEYLPK